MKKNEEHNVSPINGDVGLDDEAVQVRGGGLEGGRHRCYQEDDGQ